MSIKQFSVNMKRNLISITAASIECTVEEYILTITKKKKHKYLDQRYIV